MLELQSWLLFAAAGIALILVPGPAQALVIANTLDHGRSQGALTAVGLNLGTLFHAAAAGLGLSAVLATSALAFAIVKCLGAAYLLYLGIKALTSRARSWCCWACAWRCRSDSRHGMLPRDGPSGSCTGEAGCPQWLGKAGRAIFRPM